MNDKIFTQNEFNKTDYCYELDDEKLTDDTDMYIEETLNLIYDDTTQHEIDEIIENAKKIKVFEKDYAKIQKGRIEEWIADYFEDNYYCTFFDFDIVEQTEIKPLIDEIVKKINESKCWYTSGNMVGYLDLSNELKEAIEDETKNNTNIKN